MRDKAAVRAASASRTDRCNVLSKFLLQSGNRNPMKDLCRSGRASSPIPTRLHLPPVRPGVGADNPASGAYHALAEGGDEHGVRPLVRRQDRFMVTQLARNSERAQASSRNVAEGHRRAWRGRHRINLCPRRVPEARAPRISILPAYKKVEPPAFGRGLFLCASDVPTNRITRAH